MASFRLTKPYTMAKDDVRAAAQRLAGRLEQQHAVHAHWEGDSVRIKGSGIDAKLSFHDNLVDISVHMGLIASAFQRPLKAEIQRYLDEMIS
ncbi:polyhydroxyalkanoic acid synthase [Kineobactrum sediminis]|uniref:Polyhydroxyalkanoic acid synthase n=1 Tax=Kineobactrum sediminis TaxID=1905677 RepID=A0A2N5Y6U7_9GAMM|nr:polyhydroxyalkanoic acid system family protein [Kineobactrum sediminis]PLW84123.1 polyhydroxyalkanoic acid synthase [Kineobactrum sediminis]